MSTINLVGPATISHDGTDIGKTSGGGSLTILEQTAEILSDTYERKVVPYAIEGRINRFELNQSITISDSMELCSRGEVVIDLSEGQIKLFSARLLLPSDMAFGTLEHNPFTLRIEGGKDSSGDLFKIN